jgi:hypothetical protein
MSAEDDFYLRAGGELFARAEPRLCELLAEQGVSDPHELQADLRWKLFRRAIVETAAVSAPTANLGALDHGLRAFAHPAFSPALSRVTALTPKESNAFALAAGIDAAVVLAGFGLHVAPVDRKSPRLLADASNDIDTVIDRFSRWKTAFVGYSSCAAPFYFLVTDCVRTLQQRLDTHAGLQHVRTLFQRSGKEAPRGMTKLFQHGLAIFAREAADQIPTFALQDPSPTAGSIVLYAGWIEDGLAKGAPNGGYIPVPIQFLRHAISDPSVAFWIWHPVGVRSYLQ